MRNLPDTRIIRWLECVSNVLAGSTFLRGFTSYSLLSEGIVFVIKLTYVKPVDEVDRFLSDHKAWVKKGFDEGVFLLSGGLRPRTGGLLLALGNDRGAIETRVSQDPFIVNSVASACIMEVMPSSLDERLGFVRSS